MELTAKIEREALSDGTPIYVALCLELDIASQGDSVEAAKNNLVDAIELFLETASPSELERRVPAELSREVYVTRIEVPFGQTAGLVGAASL